MKQLFTRFTISSSLILLILLHPWQIILSCGPYLAPDEDRFALFRQGLVNNNALNQFAYTENRFDFLQVDPDSLDWKKNCNEWKAFTGDAVKLNDIYDIQYKTPPDKFLSASNSGNWKAFANNSYISWLTKKGNKDALQYMTFAKQVEATQTIDTDPWDTTVNTSRQYMRKLALIAAGETKNAKSEFLRQRYAFQAIKMFHYSGIRGAGNPSFRLYKNYLEKSNSILGAWVFVYLAKMEPNKQKQTRYLLKAFDRSEEKKAIAYFLLDKDMLTDLLTRPVSAHERALTYTMLAMRNKGKALPEIKEVLAAEPNCKYLPLLITREVNKLENWIWSGKWLGFYNNSLVDEYGNEISNETPLQQLNDRQYLALFSAFLKKTALSAVVHRDFISLARVHLYNMQGRYNESEQIMSAVKTSSKAVEMQKLVEQFIITINTKKISDPVTQAALVKIINRLAILQPALNEFLQVKQEEYYGNEYKESNDDVAELLLMLSRKFQDQGNVVYAGLLYQKANISKNHYDGWERDDHAGYNRIAYFDRHAEPTDLDKLLSLKHKHHKTAFEKLLSPMAWADDDQYRDLKGTILIRQKKYNKALETFSLMKPDYWKQFYEFRDYLPLTSVTHTGNLIPSETSQPSAYKMVSKKLIVQDIVNTLEALERATAADDQAIQYYKLGNAYYNISFWGKAWMAFSYGKSYTELYPYDKEDWHWSSFTFHPNAEKYEKDYYRLNTAQTMYKKAFMLSANPELKAKSLIMMATCASTEDSFMAEKHEADKKYRSKGDMLLLYNLNQFSQTDAYQKAAMFCPDVKEFTEKYQ